MENQNQKTKKKIYKRWWFWVIVVFVIIVIIAASGDGNKDEQQNKQLNQEISEVEIIDYTILREWNPDKNPDAIGIEILISEEDASKENIINLVKSIGSKTQKAVIKVYQNKETWDQEQSGNYGEEYNNGYLAFYVKNLTGSGAYRGFNEIRWFQANGQLEELMGTKTEIE